jgi:hypothetical protein
MLYRVYLSNQYLYLKYSLFFIIYCLSQGFYSCTNIMTKKQVGEERVYLAYTSILLFITKGSQDWNSSRSGSKSWFRDHGGMFFTGLPHLACSVCSLIEPKTTSPEMVPPTRSLSPLITNWENALQLDLMEAFPQLKLLSLWQLQLCQVDTKLASTVPKGLLDLANKISFSEIPPCKRYLTSGLPSEKQVTVLHIHFLPWQYMP